LDTPELIVVNQRFLIAMKLTRRELIHTGMMSGVAAVMPPCLATTNALPLITKAIPSSKERLPVIGLGTIWYRDAQYAQLKAVIERMYQLGGTLIDTAAAYGESEGVVGRSLAELSLQGKMLIATKFDSGSMDIPGLAGMGAGPPPSSPQSPPQGAPPAGTPSLQANPLPGPPTGVTRPERDGIGGRASFERSLQRLHNVDLLQVHGLNGTDTLMPLLMEWKQDKKIRYIGVTTSSVGQHEQVVATMKRYPLDFVQIDYSIGNRDAEHEVFNVAQERGVAVLANLPLGRATLLKKMAERPLPSWTKDINVSTWAQFLLKYVVSHPAVTCAIPGITQLEHMEDNMQAARGVLPDAAIRKRMEEVWNS
jgi:aryl-alcohol dehydrogenase-like predicted oxidoreductase